MFLSGCGPHLNIKHNSNRIAGGATKEMQQPSLAIFPFFSFPRSQQSIEFEELKAHTKIITSYIWTADL